VEETEGKHASLYSKTTTRDVPGTVLIHSRLPDFPREGDGQESSRFQGFTGLEQYAVRVDAVTAADNNIVEFTQLTVRTPEICPDYFQLKIARNKRQSWICLLHL
jgi:hypothetical protein